MNAPLFPVYMDLRGNNCGIIGGGVTAARCGEILVRCGARITVVSPTMCPALWELERAGHVRYIPRKFFRGDCSHMVLCVAAADDRAVNLAVAAECKAKGVPVFVADAEEYGTFRFPAVIHRGEITLSLAGPDRAAVRAAEEELMAFYGDSAVSERPE